MQDLLLEDLLQEVQVLMEALTCKMEDLLFRVSQHSYTFNIRSWKTCCCRNRWRTCPLFSDVQNRWGITLNLQTSTACAIVGVNCKSSSQHLLTEAQLTCKQKFFLSVLLCQGCKQDVRFQDSCFYNYSDQVRLVMLAFYASFSFRVSN